MIIHALVCMTIIEESDEAAREGAATFGENTQGVDETICGKATVLVRTHGALKVGDRDSKDPSRLQNPSALTNQRLSIFASQVLERMRRVDERDGTIFPRQRLREVVDLDMGVPINPEEPRSTGQSSDHRRSGDTRPERVVDVHPTFDELRSTSQVHFHERHRAMGMPTEHQPISSARQAMPSQNATQNAHGS